MESSTQQNMAFRVQVKLNPVIHGDAIAALRAVTKAELAEVVALFLQYGAMAHQRISAGLPAFDAGAPERALNSAEPRAPGESKTKTASKATSTLPGPVVNPLGAAGFNMKLAAEAFAIPAARPH